MNLYHQAEKGFDKLFDYTRQLSEPFEYANIMRNGSITKQVELQKQEVQSSEKKVGINQDRNNENFLTFNLENKKTNNIVFNTNSHIATQQGSNTSIGSLDKQGASPVLDLLVSFISPEIDSTSVLVLPEEFILKPRKKKRKRRKM